MNSELIRRTGLSALLLLSSSLLGALQAQTAGDWPVFGYDSGATRFSPLKQITPANVHQLQPAWSYNMRPEGVARLSAEQIEAQALQTRLSYWGIRPGGTGASPAPAWPPQSDLGESASGEDGESESSASAPSSGSEFTPIVVKGVMYFGSPFGRVVALDATTGEELWTLPLRKYEQITPRGLAYWPGDKKNAARLVIMTLANRVFTVDPATGKINSQFGQDGSLNLRTPEVMGSFPTGQLAANAMPVLYRNLMIIGSRGQENPRLGPRGDVRAFDIVTGKLVWKFNAIPEPGEPNFGTWEGDSWKDRAGVNVWNSATVDERRGIVYLGFGTPAFDREGTDRPGAGLYGTSLVAVDARTGTYRWHFQTVHHDIWDNDMPVIPTLMEMKRGARTVPVVAAMTKTSLLFILDRVTGKPMFDVVETPVPASNVPGEKAWPTQPIPAKPAALARQSIDLQTDISDVTPEHQAWCRKFVEQWQLKGTRQFTPIGFNEFTVHFPGIFGGMDWWGGAFDKKHGYYIANVSNQASVQMLRKGRDGKIELGVQPGTWFANPRDRGMPCQKGPWGELMAVDIATGDIAWRVSLGVTDGLPEGKQNTGRPMMGGPIVTAGGVIFVAATDDKRFRAFESKTGKLLWETKLKAAGHSTPLTYQGRDGKQYVALIATGGTFLSTASTSDDLVVYALP